SRLTKLIVIASNLAALWLVVELVSRGFPSIFRPTIIAFATGLLCALIVGDFAVSAALALMYAVPAVCFVRFNVFVYSYYAIWLAGLSGAMLPRSIRSGWAYPRRFAAPLVLWA